MKREVTRRRQLPAFSIDRAQLELLWERLASLFEAEGHRHFSLSVTLPNEKITFNTLDEVRQASLPNLTAEFSLYMSQGARTIHFTSGSSFNYFSTITATSDSESWCAGAVEIFATAANAGKRWYSSLVAVPFGILLMLAMSVPTVLMMLGSKSPLAKSLPTISVWWASIVALAVFWHFRSKLFPAAAILGPGHEPILRRYSSEIGLVLAAIAAAAALLQLVLL